MIKVITELTDDRQYGPIHCYLHPTAYVQLARSYSSQYAKTIRERMMEGLRVGVDQHWYWHGSERVLRGADAKHGADGYANLAASHVVAGPVGVHPVCQGLREGSPVFRAGPERQDRRVHHQVNLSTYTHLPRAAGPRTTNGNSPTEPSALPPFFSDFG